LLLNIQALGKPLNLEVRVGSERQPGVGRAFDHAEVREDMRSSYRTLAALAAEGLFRRRGRAVYVLEFHFHSADDWRDFLARSKTDRIEADHDRLASALAHPDGRIVGTERTTVSTYDRLGGKSRLDGSIPKPQNHP